MVETESLAAPQTPPAGSELELLAGLHYLRDFDQERLKQMVEVLVRQSFSPGDKIILEGTPAEALILIHSGLVSVQIEDEAQERPRLEAGDTFGELDLWRGRDYYATLTAVEPTTVYFWEVDPLERTLEEEDSAIDSFRYAAESQRLALRLSFDWLGEDEVIRALARKDRNVLIQMMSLPILLAIAGGAMLVLTFGSAWAWLGGLLLGVGSLLAAWRYVDWGNDYYIVTDRRVVVHEKVIGIYDNRQEAPLHMLLSVSVETDLASRTLGFGDVMIRTYTGQLTFTSVNDPHSMAALIEAEVQRRQRDSAGADREDVEEALRRRLEGDAGADAGAEPEPEIPEVEQKPIGDSVGLGHWAPDMRFTEGGVTTYRKHWFVLLKAIVVPSVLLIILVGLIGARLGGTFEFVSVSTALTCNTLLIVGIFVWWVYQYMDWVNDIYQISPTHIIDVYKKPLSRELRKLAPLENILGTEVKRRGIFGLILNYGDVIANVGTSEFVFEGVLSPNRIQQDIARAQETFLETRRQGERDERREELAEWFSVYHETTEQKDPRK
ncbi:MAG: cyclic nucleotide-binding domain-containing protein [Chloroflexi bacterium]|nr:cyclic nucleotide-binding domain-containing protein [Chloroflexota bacterium]